MDAASLIGIRMRTVSIRIGSLFVEFAPAT